jgi:hypothetical protein
MNLLKAMSHPNVLEYLGEATMLLHGPSLAQKSTRAPLIAATFVLEGMFCKARKLFMVTEYIGGGTLQVCVCVLCAIFSPRCGGG